MTDMTQSWWTPEFGMIHGAFPADWPVVTPLSTTRGPYSLVLKMGDPTYVASDMCVFVWANPDGLLCVETWTTGLCLARFFVASLNAAEFWLEKPPLLAAAVAGTAKPPVARSEAAGSLRTPPGWASGNPPPHRAA
jgi:hypothetical protein